MVARNEVNAIIARCNGGCVQHRCWGSGLSN
jgi:hypothetical protein